MTLPDIPEQARDAAWAALPSPFNAAHVDLAVAAAWPQLYAAALRHAADEMHRSLGLVHGNAATRELRRLADTALTEPLLDDGNQPGGP